VIQEGLVEHPEAECLQAECPEAECPEAADRGATPVVVRQVAALEGDDCFVGVHPFGCVSASCFSVAAERLYSNENDRTIGICYEVGIHMDPVNRLIAWAAYVTGAVLIGSAAFFAFHYYRQGSISADIAQAGLVAGREWTVDLTSETPSDARGVPVEQLFLQRAQIRRLQALLDQKTKLLQQRTLLLDQRNAEEATLRAELDDAIEMLEVLAVELAATAVTPAGGSGNGAKLQNELEKLRIESAKSREHAERQQQELEQLREELGTTDLDIAQLQQQAEQEFEALLTEREAFEGVVTETLARIGGDAVPVLVYQLAHPRPDVRKWAATMLGELGPVAKEAIPPLQDALKDRDPAVGTAARSALDKIAPPHR
jgi:flagellar motility protein MotE (MotC chaperone)